MRLYYEIAVRAFHRATIYRSAYVAGILTNAFFGAVFSYMYLAIYAGHDEMAGMTVHDALTYVWITQSLISVGAGWLGWDLERAIRSGDVITDLMRPWHFYTAWFTQWLGERLFNLLVRGSLTYVIGVLYFGAAVPAPGDALAFLAALALGLIVSSAYMFMVNALAFWLLDTTGIMVIANLVLGFFSGFFLPLAFFPPALAALAAILPFHTITSVPARVWMGEVRGAELLATLALQLFWAVALTGAALLVLRAVMRKVVIQGG